MHNMKNKSLVSINDYSKDEYLKIIDLAEEFEKNPNQDILIGKVVATLFFEPSTRTRLSFETAVKRLGGKVIGFSDAGSSSVTKGSLCDCPPASDVFLSFIDRKCKMTYLHLS